jgi:hypothetical protein
VELKLKHILPISTLFFRLTVSFTGSARSFVNSIVTVDTL